MTNVSNSWMPAVTTTWPPNKPLEEIMKELEMQKTYESKTDRCDHCEGTGRRSLDRVEVLVTLDDDEKVVSVQTTPEVWDHISKVSKPQKNDKVTITFEGVDVVFTQEKQELPSAHPEGKVYPSACGNFEYRNVGEPNLSSECTRCGFTMVSHSKRMDQAPSPEKAALDDYHRRVKEDVCIAFVWPYDGKNRNCGKCGKTYGEHLHGDKE